MEYSYIEQREGKAGIMGASFLFHLKIVKRAHIHKNLGSCIATHKEVSCAEDEI